MTSILYGTSNTVTSMFDTTIPEDSVPYVDLTSLIGEAQQELILANALVANAETILTQVELAASNSNAAAALANALITNATALITTLTNLEVLAVNAANTANYIATHLTTMGIPKLLTAREIAVTGFVVGAALFDGSANIDIITTLNPLAANGSNFTFTGLPSVTLEGAVSGGSDSNGVVQTTYLGNVGYPLLPSEVSTVPISMGFGASPIPSVSIPVVITQPTLFTGFANSIAYAMTPATNPAVFSIGYIANTLLTGAPSITPLGTCTFAGTVYQGYFPYAGAVSLPVGSALVFTTPNPPDATLAGVAMTILCNKT